MNVPGNVPGSTINPVRGEIWHARLEPTEGAEQGKARPVVVLSVARVGRPSIRLCVPLMGFQPSHAGKLWYRPIAPSASNNLDKLSTADVMQARAVDVLRFEYQIGVLESIEVEALAAILALCVGHSPSSGATPPST